MNFIMWPGTQYKRRGAAAGESDLWLTSFSISESGICFPEIFFLELLGSHPSLELENYAGRIPQTKLKVTQSPPDRERNVPEKKCKERFL